MSARSNACACVAHHVSLREHLVSGYLQKLPKIVAGQQACGHEKVNWTVEWLRAMQDCLRHQLGRLLTSEHEQGVRGEALADAQIL